VREGMPHPPPPRRPSRGLAFVSAIRRLPARRGRIVSRCGTALADVGRLGELQTRAFVVGMTGGLRERWSTLVDAGWGRMMRLVPIYTRAAPA
jgi:hypothetical protein